MWNYDVRSARLSHDDEFVAVGYSGLDEDMNDPDAESVQGKGPIPAGFYRIGSPYDSEDHGPVVLPLTPDEDNEEYGRSGFLIHGDSLHRPGHASHGCIILSRIIREQIASSQDNRLQVS